MKLVSLSYNSHDGSITFLKDGKIVSHTNCERITRIKYDNRLEKSFSCFLDNLDEKYDHLSSIIFSRDLIQNEIFQIIFQENSKLNGPKSTNIKFSDHHLCHAYSGFYSSKFDDALCFIFDGDGSQMFDLVPNAICLEKESVFLFKDGKCDNIPLYSEYRLNDFPTSNIDHQELNKIDRSTDDIILGNDKLITKNYSIGAKFELLSLRCGFHWNDAGKVMGLAQFKDHEDRLPQEYNSDFWKNKVDESSELQKFSKNKITALIQKYHKETGIKNIVISGGVGLNCVINYQLVKEFPNLNFHIDPVCSDSGISLGNAFYQYIQETKKIPNRINHTYYGIKEYDYDILKYDNKKVNYNDVANLLIDGNLVAIFQGRSEIGKRSLGNRSLLFDPRVNNGQDIVNDIKKREKFRPFAASILFENVNDWFDLKTLDESPYMSFAVDAKPGTSEKVPSVIHADNTSRIQTVKEDQNYHFYNLIKKFYEKTGVPMVLNTSFNLAGEPLVESFSDAIDTLYGSDIEYLYLPEIQTLITIKNNTKN